MKTLKEQQYKYKEREFCVKLLKDDNGFRVIVMDKAKNKQVNVAGGCSYENCLEIYKSGIGVDPITELIEAIKQTINLWVDRGLI